MAHDPTSQQPHEEDDDRASDDGQTSSDHDGPIDLEPDEPVAVVPVEDVENCPNCGAPMPESEALVCLRCGYDLKKLQVTRTAVLQEEVDEDEPNDDASSPLVRPGLGNHALGMAMAAGAGLILLIGHLAGVTGLFADAVLVQNAEGEMVVPWLRRLLGSGQLFVLLAVLCSCGVAGLYMLSQVMHRPLGDLSLAATRMLGIVAVMRLVTFFNIAGPQWVEWLAEALAQGAVFVGLSMLIFALKLRDTLILGLSSLIALVVIWLIAWITIWSIQGGL